MNLNIFGKMSTADSKGDASSVGAIANSKCEIASLLVHADAADTRSTKSSQRQKKPHCVGQLDQNIFKIKKIIRKT